MTQIQKTLKLHGISKYQDVKKLFTEKYNINVKESKTFPSLYLLMYDMIKTNFSEPVAHECRGIILEKDTNKVVCYPFNKFFNYGEKHANLVDWDTVSIQEKLDGSLIKVFFYNGDWVVATNGTIDARESSYSNRNFYDLFHESISNEFYSKLNPELTYVFELIHPENIIVIDYKLDKPKIVHLGTRHNTTYQEINVDIGIEKPTIFKFGSSDDLKQFSLTMPLSQEGFVICDSIYNRNKIKGTLYVQAHHLKDTNNPLETCLNLYFRGEESETLTYFPHHKGFFDKIHILIDGLVKEIKTISNQLFLDVELLNGKEKQKQYAIGAKKHPSIYMPLLMCIFKEGKPVGDTFIKNLLKEKMPAKKLIEQM